MHVGLIGAGRMGAHHATLIVEDERVSRLTVVDADASRAREIADRHGASVGADAETLMRDGIDALVIAAPTPLHAPLIIAACEHGIPVLCEKPIALDYEATNEVVTVARQTGSYVQLGFQRRYDPGFMRARGAVMSGDLGSLYMARMGTHDPDPPPVDYLKVSGGVFRDMFIHDFDAVRYVTGDEVSVMYAVAANLVDPAIGEIGDVDTCALILTMASGALVTLTGCRRDPRGYDVRVELFGSRDSITVGLDPRTPLRSVDDGGLLDGSTPGWSFFLDRFATAYRDQMDGFLTNVARHAPASESPCTPEDGREAMLLAIAAECSIEWSQAVSVDGLREQLEHV